MGTRTDQDGLKRSPILRALSAASALFFLLFAAQAVEYMGYRAAQVEQAAAQSRDTADDLSREIASLLDRVETEARNLSRNVEALQDDEPGVENALREASLNVAEVRGATACYEPFAFDPERRLYCPYYFKVAGEVIDIADSYDYTQPGDGTQWYTRVIAEGARWTSPYFGAGGGEWYIDYGIPIRLPGESEPVGIVDLALEVGDFQAIIHRLTIGRTARTYLVAPDGAFAAHPDPTAIGTRTIDMLEGDPVLSNAAQFLRTGERGMMQVPDALSGDTAFVAYGPVGETGFGLLSVSFQSDLITDATGRNRRVVTTILLLAAALLLAATRYFARDRLDEREVVGLSAVTALILLGTIVLVGALQHSLAIAPESNESPPLLNSAALDMTITGETGRAEALRLPPPTAVPTALYIERLEFADAYNVNVSGQLWQKYPLDIADAVQTGVRFPQLSPFAESAYLEEAYREDIAGLEGGTGYRLIGYDLRLTLRLNLSYRDFPFDKRKLDIRLAPASHTDNLLFVPDLAAYEDTAPARRPGLSPDIELPGSEIVSTYYNLTYEDFATDFGSSGRSQYQHVPMLHYNIQLKRYLLNAFVTYLIPIGVTLAMIFILLIASEKRSERQGIIESMAAFIFVLVFSHIDLRKDIVTADLMFIEYFYFIAYAMIILSTFNLIAYTRSRVGWFDWQDNLLYKALYFPIVLGLILCVMLLSFY